jgi:hypothetical protein
VPEVLGSAGDQRCGLGVGECLGAGSVGHLEISPVGHDPAARQGEDATAGASSELGEVVTQQFRQLGMNRNRTGFFLGPVLEFPALADAVVIGPVGAASRPDAV